MARIRRFSLSDEVDDLNKSVLHLTESILLPPQSWLEDGPLILRALFLLAFALWGRSVVSGLPEDAIYAAKYLRHLRDRPHAAFGFPHLVAGLLVDVLASQVEMKAGNVMQNIEEMTALCHELLTSDLSGNYTTPAVTTLYRVVWSTINPWVPDQLLNPVIGCLRLARVHKPELRVARFILAYCLISRYCMTFVDDDYEEAASILDEIITSVSPGDRQDKVVNNAHNFMGGLAWTRSVMRKTPEDLEEAMYRIHASLGSPSRDYSRSFLNQTLEDTAKQRFLFFGPIEGLEASSKSGISPSSQPVPAVSFGGYEDDESEFDPVKEMRLLREFLSGIRNDDLTKIDEAIEKGRTILSSSDPTHTFVSPLLDLFGWTLFDVFQRTNKIEYLNEAISTYRQILERPSPQFLRYERLLQLSMSLYFRFMSCHLTQDLDEVLELLSQCVKDRHTGSALPSARFRLACFWASVARDYRHPSVSKAYESAVSLMQDTLFFAPTLQLQHATLAERSDTSHRMLALDYASYQVDLGQSEGAIETLERGRALLWSEMRHLRASIDQLMQADPQLGHKFAEINRDLEELTKSVPPSHKLSIDDGGADDVMAVDPFGRLLLKQRRLLKERDKLISQIQALPGFDCFMIPLPFDAIRSAASSGPVIIINHSKYRSDILILRYNASPSLIPTPRDFYRRASALKDELLDARNKYGPDSNHYNQTLAYILTELYDLVGKPVIDRLRQLKVPEQSRVWWCPTSVFCALPLHAMGPISSDDGDDDRYFLDLYIPSYTPTLSALIPESDRRQQGSPTSVLPSLLLVAHFDVPSPDVSLSDVCEDVKIVQALNTRLPVKSLISEGATTTSALDGLRDHQFVHFVCHGTLEASKPFDAGFELHGNERLTLLDIVRSRLPAAEFAFLSACHTAELTDGSSADEGLHLAAAVQYCGFRSVVGTMWAMANEDGPDLAKHFYKSMFPRREQGEPVPYYKRSAGALRDAVKQLRKKRGITLERWVNFVHYGS